MGLRDRLQTAAVALVAPAPAPAPAPRMDAAPPAPAPELGPVDKLRVRLDSVLNSITSLGTANDKSKATRPDTGRQRMRRDELEALYRYNGYARRIVDIMPDSATRTGWTVQAEAEEGQEVEADPMADADEALGTLAAIGDADRWARLYGGALVLLVTRESKPAEFTSSDPVVQARLDADWLREPLDLARVEALEALVVLDRQEFEAVEWDARPSSPTFRKPLIYSISPQVQGAAPLSATRVHASRVITFTGAKLPPSLRLQTDTGLGDSVLEVVWDAIRGKSSSDQAGEVLTHEAKIDVLKIDGLAALEAEDQATVFTTRMKALALQKSLLNMILIGDGEQFETRASSLTGWSELDTKQQERLSAATGLPLTVLFGQSPGGLSTDDAAQRDNMNKLVRSYQRDRYQVPLRRIYQVVYASSDGPTKGVEPESWEVVFAPLDEPSQKECAETGKLRAETDAIYLDRDVLTPEHVTASRFGPGADGGEILPVDLAQMKRDMEAEREAAREALAAEQARMQAAAMASADTDADTDTEATTE